MFKKRLIGDVIAVGVFMVLLKITEVADLPEYIYIIAGFIGIITRIMLKKWFPVVDRSEYDYPYENQSLLIIIILFAAMETFTDMNRYLSVTFLFIAIEINSYIFYKRKQKKSSYSAN